MRSEVTEGTSALFLMTSGAVMDKVQDAVKEHNVKFTIVTTNLSKEQEEELRKAFEAGEEEAEA